MWKEQNFLHMFTEKYILLLCIHFKKQRLLSDQFDPLPFSAPETQPEQRAPEKPVQDHSRPDAYNAPSMDDQKDHGKMQSLRRQLVKVFRLSVISRSHALAYHSDHSDPYRKSRYGLHSAILLATALAAICTVPNPDIMDTTRIRPNWKIPFSTPLGIPIYRIFLIRPRSRKGFTGFIK